MSKPALVVDHLVLRTATEQAEIDHLRQALNQGHYLKAGRSAGHVLWQGIYRTDTEADCPELVAVLCWGGSAKRLKERDNHIGWDAVTCANRLKLVVQLRRFYVMDSGKPKHLWIRPLKKDALALLVRPGILPPALHQLAQRSLAEIIQDEWVGDWEKDHGRIERRRIARVDLDWDISLFPGARQLVRITREWMEGKSSELKSETRYFITSLAREERSAARLAQAIRGHWSVENRNHWKRDTSLWKEDASRPRKKASGGQVLALLRGVVLRLHDNEAFASLNASFHHHGAKPHAALRLLKTPPPQIN